MHRKWGFCKGLKRLKTPVDSGVIKDADEFVNELIARGLDTSVRIGQYNFKKDMTMDEVFKVLFD